MRKGRLNLISDVDGVLVGHKTIVDDDHQTGVTFIRTADDIYHHKCPAASYVINGYGKSVGLIQIDELGTLESYIALTNTLNVGTVLQALSEIMIEENDDLVSVNCVVGECNDSYLNDIRHPIITKTDVYDAYHDCASDFKLGSIGAGRGMSCFEMSGGIGSSSRIFSIAENEYTLGVLVLTNFGLMHQYRLDKIDADVSNMIEKGSIIMIIATDAPLSSRQLKRVAKRMPVALGLCGSMMGNGSGDIVIAYSTYDRVGDDDINIVHEIKEASLNIVFEAAIDACIEAIHRSLLENEDIEGYQGHKRKCLSSLL